MGHTQLRVSLHPMTFKVRKPDLGCSVWKIA